MSECSDILFLSALACQIAKCTETDELEMLAANFVVIGDMLAAIAVRRGICCDKEKERQHDDCCDY